MQEVFQGNCISAKCWMLDSYKEIITQCSVINTCISFTLLMDLFKVQDAEFSEEIIAQCFLLVIHACTFGRRMSNDYDFHEQLPIMCQCDKNNILLRFGDILVKISRISVVCRLYI